MLVEYEKVADISFNKWTTGTELSNLGFWIANSFLYVPSKISACLNFSRTMNNPCSKIHRQQPEHGLLSFLSSLFVELGWHVIMHVMQIRRLRFL